MGSGDVQEMFEKKGGERVSEYTYLGNFSAVDPAYSIGMSCDSCKVEWTGCWDNFQCPKCGEGELPSNNLPSFLGVVTE